MPTPHILYLIAVIVCVMSVSKYGAREEWGALAGVVVASILTPIVQQHEFRSTEFGIMAVDLVLLTWLTAISLVSNRYWPMFAAGFHLAGSLVHLAPMSRAELSGLAYGYAATGSAYLVLLAIAVGAAFETQRLPLEAPEPQD
jgi:hypothetical protein